MYENLLEVQKIKIRIRKEKIHNKNYNYEKNTRSCKDKSKIIPSSSSISKKEHYENEVLLSTCIGKRRLPELKCKNKYLEFVYTAY